LKVKCCGLRVLSQEPDFLEKKEWLTEEVEKLGHDITTPSIIASLIHRKYLGVAQSPSQVNLYLQFQGLAKYSAYNN
jgi:hypothetical protein